MSKQTARKAALEKVAPLFIFAFALMPRLAAIGRYITPDELIWVHRSLGLREAVLSADWAATIQAGHPGVTVTWLGALGIQLQRWLQPSTQADIDWLLSLYWLSPDNTVALQKLAVFLTSARLVVVLTTSLGIVAIYQLAKTRLNKNAALWGAGLLALDPFVGGLSGLLHVDALLATFMVIALLLALPRWENKRPISHHNILLVGIFCALSVLTKSPGIVILPFAGLLVLWRLRDHTFKSALPLFFLGILAFSLTLTILLPALISAPEAVWATVSGLANKLIETAVRPTFFMGQLTFDHGLKFYPIALAFRLAPIVLIGLIALAFSLQKEVSLLALLLFSLAFLLALTTAEKKFDRYALPAIFAIILLAGWGIERLLYRWQNERVSTIFLLLPLFYLLINLPYPLYAYNWLVGGKTTAPLVMPQGWGEAESLAAQQLSTQPNASERTLFSDNLTSTAPYFSGTVTRLNVHSASKLTANDVIIFPEEQGQADDDSPSLLPVNLEPTTTLNLAGAVRATLYSGIDASSLDSVPSTKTTTAIQFADKLKIVSVNMAEQIAWPQSLRIELGMVAQQSANYQIRLDLISLNENGQRQVRASVEYPLLNSTDQPVSAWSIGQADVAEPKGDSSHFLFPIPPELPPATYFISTTIIDASGAQLGAVDTALGEFIGVSPQLASVDIAASVNQPEALPTSTQLVNPLRSSIGTGEALTADIWYRTTTTDPITLTLILGNQTLSTPLANNNWPRNYTYQLQPTWRIPPDFPAGNYVAHLQAVRTADGSLIGQSLPLGELNVVALERKFSLPSDVTPLGIQAGSVTLLQAVETDNQSNQLSVRTIWQATEPNGIDYTLFIHVRDEAGNILAQRDVALDPNSSTWIAEQVIDNTIVLDTPDGFANGSIAIGLYNPETGARLQLFDDGIALENDQYLTSGR